MIVSSLQRPERVAIVAALLAWPLVLATHLGAIDLAFFAGLGADRAPVVVGALLTGLAAAPGWLLMSGAMMIPVVLPATRHVALNSLRPRRDRAVALTLGAYLGVWALFGVVAVTGVSLWNRTVAPGSSGWLLAGAIVIAVAWQVSPWKRRFLGGCQAGIPLPARGWRATSGSIRFGLVYGVRCIGSCWALMLVMAVATHGHLLWTLTITAFIVGERRLDAIRRLRWPALAAAGTIALALTLPAIAAESSTIGGSNPVEGWFCRITSG